MPLRGVIEAFVTREGTADYGAQEVPLATKVFQMQQQLDAGTAGPRSRRGHRELHDSARELAYGPSPTYGLAHGQSCGIGTKEVGY